MENANAQLRLTGIEILAKTIVQQKPEYNLSIFHFNFKVENKVNKDRKVNITFCEFTIFDESKGNTLANFNIAVIFEIANFDEVIKQTGDHIYEIPDELDMTLKSVAISTCRGIIYSECRGTYLHNAFLPIINPFSLLSDKKEEGK